MKPFKGRGRTFYVVVGCTCGGGEGGAGEVTTIKYTTLSK